jgi:hypothetical protein
MERSRLCYWRTLRMNQICGFAIEVTTLICHEVDPRDGTLRQPSFKRQMIINGLFMIACYLLFQVFSCDNRCLSMVFILDPLCQRLPSNSMALMQSVRAPYPWDLAYLKTFCLISFKLYLPVLPFQIDSTDTIHILRNSQGPHRQVPTTMKHRSPDVEVGSLRTKVP